MPIRPQRPLPEQRDNPYLPPGPPPLLFEAFQGINTSTSRPGVKDEEMWWCDGFMPIGPRLLRTMPGNGSYIFAAALTSEPPGTTIVFFGFCNIGTTPLCITFLSNGSIYATNTITAVSQQIAIAGTITNPSPLTTGMCQRGSDVVIIVTQQTDGYFIFDGTTFFKPGDLYPPEADLVPTAIGGNTVEIYQGRVWIGNGPTLIFSAPGSIIDFADADGGGAITSSDSFLRISYSAFRQSNGFLYLIADSSVNYISGVQTAAGPPVLTTFTNQNADPEVGSPWPGTVGTFGRNIIFANQWGVHVSYGAAVSKISEPLDGIYNTVPNFGSFLPSAAKAIVFGKRIWMLLLPIIDPYTHAQTNKLLIWNGAKLWFASNAITDLVPMLYIQSQELASVITAWGSDGFGVFPLFTAPSSGFTKVAMSKLWDSPQYNLTKSTSRIDGLFQFYQADVGNNVTVLVDNETSFQTANPATAVFGGMQWTNVDGASMTWFNVNGDEMAWGADTNVISAIQPTAISQNGRLLGLTAYTDAPDMAIISLMLTRSVTKGNY